MRQNLSKFIEYDNDKPIYKVFDGWLSSTEGITEYSELPEKAKEYIEFIEDLQNALLPLSQLDHQEIKRSLNRFR